MHTNNTLDKQLKSTTLPPAGLHVKGVLTATAIRAASGGTER